MSIETGIRADIEIDGQMHSVGVAELPTGWEASYMPKTSYRFKVGYSFNIPEYSFIVTESGMSERVPSMVLLKLRPADGNFGVTNG